LSKVFTKTKRSRILAAIRSKQNNDTELKLVSILRGHGIKRWVRHQPLPSSPDVAFRRERLARFLGACF